MKLDFHARFLVLAALSLTLSGCAGLGMNSGPPPTPTPTPGSLNSLNHIILFMQENRSFDHYFGQLNAYRAKQTPPLPQALDPWPPRPKKPPATPPPPGNHPNPATPPPPIK